MHYVYVLQSVKDAGYYVGYTGNLNRRMREHNSGRTRSLRHRRPLELIYWEEYQSKSRAKERERQIKSWKGGEAFRKLVLGSPRFQRD